MHASIAYIRIALIDAPPTITELILLDIPCVTLPFSSRAVGWRTADASSWGPRRQEHAKDSIPISEHTRRCHPNLKTGVETIFISGSAFICERWRRRSPVPVSGSNRERTMASESGRYCALDRCQWSSSDCDREGGAAVGRRVDSTSIPQDEE
mmetsp:Transcript_1937/g.5359  ORF Transcript_1937/g.5359 Transcript_1937/m.5359 type:complete len:153 (-) Transcript_1937:26-484(-)